MARRRYDPEPHLVAEAALFGVFFHQFRADQGLPAGYVHKWCMVDERGFMVHVGGRCVERHMNPRAALDEYIEHRPAGVRTPPPLPPCGRRGSIPPRWSPADLLDEVTLCTRNVYQATAHRTMR